MFRIIQNRLSNLYSIYLFQFQGHYALSNYEKKTVIGFENGKFLVQF